MRFLIRDRDVKYPALIDEILRAAGIATVLTGVRVPRINSIIERWVKTLRIELLDRTLIGNQTVSGTRCASMRALQPASNSSVACSVASLRPLPACLEIHQFERVDVRRHAASTNTNMPPALRGRNFRHAQPTALASSRWTPSTIPHQMSGDVKPERRVRRPTENCHSAAPVDDLEIAWPRICAGEQAIATCQSRAVTARTRITEP